MKCSRCGKSGRPGLKFCTGCGSQLGPRCGSCGAEIEADDRFCGSCAAPVSSAPAVQSASSPGPSENRRIQFNTTLGSGRYLVKEFLGEGKSKRVLKAVDTLLQREVALALVKTEGLDHAERHRLLRESRVMARLGGHPNIVPIFDLGEENGQAFIVMPVMAGGSVQQMMVTQGAPLPISQVIRIAIDVAEGLNHAHMQGLVHRDLKPGNLWISEDGVVRIGDFGLAVSGQANRITDDDVIIGTPNYMSPEQINGEPIDARSDLYSFGSVLYELITGQPPFLADKPLAILHHHLNSIPTPPNETNEECPEFLSDLVMELLEKSPDARPVDAAGVLDILKPRDQSSVGAGRSAIMSSAASSDFVGRKLELSSLTQIVGDTANGASGIAMIVGEQGVGKTRLARELTTYAKSRGVRPLWGRSYEQQGTPPYWLWMQILKSVLSDFNEEEISKALEHNSMEVAELLPELALIARKGGSGPTSSNPQQARFRLFESVVSFLSRLAETKPLTLVLDDLQWADASSTMLLEYFSQNLEKAPVLVLGLYRDRDVDAGHPLSQALGQISREERFQRIHLSGLSPKEISDLVTITTGLDASERQIAAIQDRTEGNALFVTEMIRLLADERLLGPNAPEDEQIGLRIPDGVREVVLRRLSAMPEPLIDWLSLCAIIGKEFSHKVLSRLLDGVDAIELVEGLDIAVIEGIVEEISESPGTYRFVHVLVQETLLSRQSATRIAIQHQRVGETLESMYRGDLRSHASELVRHFGAAANLIGGEKFIEYSILAGEQALATYAYEDAESYFFHAREVHESGSNDDHTSVRILYGLGLSQRATATSDMTDAWNSLASAFRISLNIGDVGRVVDIAEKLPITVEAQTSAILKSALDQVPDSSTARARILARYGNAINYEHGDFQAARSAFEEALRITRQNDEKTLEVQIITNAASLDADHMMIGECQRKSLRAISLCETSSNPQAELISRFWVSTCAQALGDSETALANARRALDLAEIQRIPSQLSTALWANETINRLLGRWMTARKHSEEALSFAPLDCRLLASRVLIEHYSENTAEVERYVERLLAVKEAETPGAHLEYAFPSIVLPIIALDEASQSTNRASEVSDLLETARQCAESVLSDSTATPSLELLARTGMLLWGVVRGDTQEIEKNLPFIELHRNLVAFGGFISLSRAAGLGCMALGDPGRAKDLFRETIALCQNAGYLVELQSALKNLAQAHIMLDETSEARFADIQAERILEQIGMSSTLIGIEGQGLQSDATMTVDHGNQTVVATRDDRLTAFIG